MSEEVADHAALVNGLAQKLDRLRVLYEQYFMGIQKMEPVVQLKEIVRLIHAIDQQNIRNTALRFRARSLIQKYNSYRAYWGRTLRAKEAGTYHRDVARVRNDLSSRGFSVPPASSVRTKADVERMLASVAEQAAEPATPKQAKKASAPSPAPAEPAPADSPPPPIALDEQGETSAPPSAQRPASPPRSEARPQRSSGQRPALPPGFSEQQMQSLYRRFVKAKTMCGEDPGSIHYETLVKTVQRQLPKIKQTHPGREVDLQVVIRGGRAILKAKPK